MSALAPHPLEGRIFCDACERAHYITGSARFGRYLLCGACRAEFLQAQPGGSSPGRYVRDKRFGEEERYRHWDAAPQPPRAAAEGRPVHGDG